MWIYLIEALGENADGRVFKKWCSKHRHHPIIKKSVPRNKFKFQYCPNWQQLSGAINDFISFQQNINLTLSQELIVLWLSVHGNLSKVGIKLDDETEYPMYKLLSLMHKKLRKAVVIIQSVCWGGLPHITFVMNKADRGPKLAFGPTIEVKVSALHHAEGEILKFLSQCPEPTSCQIKDIIDNINRWGIQYYQNYNSYYRAWFWESNRIQQYPRETKNFTCKLAI